MVAKIPKGKNVGPTARSVWSNGRQAAVFQGFTHVIECAGFRGV